ncbi:MAG: hypothetical protein ACKOAD_05640 [Gammaproteobacteria bacterium]
MLIEAQALSLQAKNQNFLSSGGIYWILSGDEFWFHESKFLIRKHLAKLGYSKLEQAENLDLFSEKNFQEVQLSGKTLSANASFPKPRPDFALLILSPGLNFNLIKTSKHGFVQQYFEQICFILPKRLQAYQYNNWAQAYIRNQGLNFEKEALKLLINQSLNNPLALKQACFRAQNSTGLNNLLNTQQVLELLDFSGKYNQFDWLQAIGHNDLKQALNILLELKKQNYEPITLVWNLAKELQSLLEIKCNTTDPTFKKINFQILALSVPQILDLIQTLPLLDAATKGLSRLPIWVILQAMTLFLASKPAYSSLFSSLFGLHPEETCKI